MKNILVLLSVIAVAQTVVKADTLSDFGNSLSNFNAGTCTSLIDNNSNDRDTCLVACTEASAYITKMFTSTEYTDSKFNPAEFLSKLGDFNIKFNAQMNQCRLVELMQAFDKRASVKSFSAGLIANLASQAAMYKKSSLWTLFDNLQATYNDSAMTSDDKYKKFGSVFFKYVSELATFTSPSAAVNTKTN